MTLFGGGWFQSRPVPEDASTTGSSAKSYWAKAEELFGAFDSKVRGNLRNEIWVSEHGVPVLFEGNYIVRHGREVMPRSVEVAAIGGGGAIGVQEVTVEERPVPALPPLAKLQEQSAHQGDTPPWAVRETADEDQEHEDLEVRRLKRKESRLERNKASDVATMSLSTPPLPEGQLPEAGVAVDAEDPADSGGVVVGLDTVEEEVEEAPEDEQVGCFGVCCGPTRADNADELGIGPETPPYPLSEQSEDGSGGRDGGKKVSESSPEAAGAVKAGADVTKKGRRKGGGGGLCGCCGGKKGDAAQEEEVMAPPVGSAPLEADGADPVEDGEMQV